MQSIFNINGLSYTVDINSPIDLSIPLRFNGPQPNAFGVGPATSVPCDTGGMVGDTRLGGSVNFEQYTFIPHCNGTHTECVGHITNQRIAIVDCLRDVLIPAVVVTVDTDSPAASGEAYVVDLDESDRLITRTRLQSGLSDNAHLLTPSTTAPAAAERALIVRTLPNDVDKVTRSYGGETNAPFFSTEAVEYIVGCGFKHLLVDLPSIDRLSDEGWLSNHRTFWNVKPGSLEIHAASRIYSTITELIYVPDQVEDGNYLLNLQIAPFASDASPSRPILFKII